MTLLYNIGSPMSVHHDS